jgi:hypothetical protein
MSPGSRAGVGEIWNVVGSFQERGLRLDLGDSWVKYGSRSGDGWNGCGRKRCGCRRGQADSSASGPDVQALAEEVDAEAAGRDGGGSFYGGGGGAGIEGGEALGGRVHGTT